MASLTWAWTLEFLDNPADGLIFRYWSGEGDLTIDSVTFAGTNGVISIQPPREAAGEAARLTATMDATDPSIRAQLRRDLGPLRIKIQFLYRNEAAQSPAWALSGKEFIGRLSAPVLAGATYIVDAESMITDIDRGRVRDWSDDAHKARNPGDRGMEFLEGYAEGIETKWPS